MLDPLDHMALGGIAGLFRGLVRGLLGTAAKGGGVLINQTSKAILKNGYYEVNGFKFRGVTK